MGSKAGAIPEWKPFTEKQFDEMGTPIGESTKFYQGQGRQPEIFDPSSEAFDPYKQAIRQANEVLLSNPKHAEEVKRRMAANFGNLFNEEDLQL